MKSNTENNFKKSLKALNSIHISTNAQNNSPYLSRATMKLDVTSLVNMSISGHQNLPKLTLSELERLENIKEVLLKIENSFLNSNNYQHSLLHGEEIEENAIYIALDENLLPGEEEILQLRLKNIKETRESHLVKLDDER